MSAPISEVEMNPLVDVDETIAIASQTEAPSTRSDILFSRYWSQIMVNTLPLLLGDLCALGVSFGLGYGVAAGFSADWPAGFRWLPLLAGMTLPVTFALFSLYPGTGLKAAAESGQVALATTLLFGIFVFSAVMDGVPREAVLSLIITALGVVATVPLFRTVARRLSSPYRWWGQPVVIFGGGETARELYNYYRSHPRLGIRPVAIIDDWCDVSRDRNVPQSAMPVADLEAICQRHDVYWALITTPLSANSAAVVRDYLSAFPHVLVVPDAEGLPSIRRQMFDCGAFPCIPMTNSLLLPLPRLLKAVMDYALVLVFGVLCLPLILTIVAIIKITAPGPALYAQRRIGKGSREFMAWKFRTMVVNADEVLEHYLNANPELRAEWERDHKLKNDPRVTTIGKILRKTSLDELPQIWNVLKGEMSLVGPRPIVTAEIPKYGEWFQLYERVTPGITGLWQVSGRNNTTYEMRVAYDTYYVLNWSPWFDLYILVRTVKVVLCHEGAY